MVKGMMDFFESILDYLDKSDKPNPFGSKSCSSCNSSLLDIYKHGKFGCSECFQNFNLDNLLMEIHGANRHVGKVPKRWKAEQDKKQKEQKFNNIHETAKSLLKDAVEKEDYDKAVAIRDSIRKLDELTKTAEIIGAKMKVAIDNKNLSEAEKSKTELDALFSKCEQIQSFISGF